MIRTSQGFTIDVSRLPAPHAIEADYEAELKRRATSLKRRYEELGIPYDVENLDTDPGMILQQEDAYRAFLDKVAINDSIRAVLPAFAKGADLDNVVSRANVERLVIKPADPLTGEPAVMESNTSLLRRYLASYAAPAAGSPDGYIFRAATAWPLAHDIAVLKAPGGKVLIHLLAADGKAAPLDAVFAVARALQKRDAAPLTDDVTVSSAEITRYDARLTVQVGRGPDPAAVREQAVQSLRRFAAERYVIGGEVPSNALEAAAYVPNVLRVIPAPFTKDVPAKPNAAPWLENLTVDLEVVE